MGRVPGNGKTAPEKTLGEIAMNVSDLNLEVLFETMRRVRAQMSTLSVQRALLNRARADTPIVDDILDQIELMAHEESPSQRSRGLECALRDMLIFLALREIEREQHDKAESRLRAARN